MEPSPSDALAQLDAQLQELIIELRAAIAERHELSSRIQRTCQETITHIDRLVMRAQTMRPLDSPGRLERITRLELEAAHFQRDILQEELSCWRDVTLLRAQLRELRKEAVLLGHHER